jgi:hypothetical protein
MIVNLSGALLKGGVGVTRHSYSRPAGRIWYSSRSCHAINGDRFLSVPQLRTEKLKE